MISPDQSDSDEDTSVTTFTQGGPSSSSLSSHETETTNKVEKVPEPSQTEDISTSQAVNWTDEIILDNDVGSMIERLKENEATTHLLPGRKDSGYGEEIFEFNPFSDLTTLRVPLIPPETLDVGLF